MAAAGRQRRAVGVIGWPAGALLPAGRFSRRRPRAPSRGMWRSRVGRFARLRSRPAPCPHEAHARPQAASSRRRLGRGGRGAGPSRGPTPPGVIRTPARRWIIKQNHMLVLLFLLSSRSARRASADGHGFARRAGGRAVRRRLTSGRVLGLPSHIRQALRAREKRVLPAPAGAPRRGVVRRADMTRSPGASGPAGQHRPRDGPCAGFPPARADWRLRADDGAPRASASASARPRRIARSRSFRRTRADTGRTPDRLAEPLAGGGMRTGGRGGHRYPFILTGRDREDGRGCLPKRCQAEGKEASAPSGVSATGLNPDFPPDTAGHRRTADEGRATARPPCRRRRGPAPHCAPGVPPSKSRGQIEREKGV
jgi:hypothetical protein